MILEYEIENTWGSGGENARAVVNGETFSREVVPEALRAAGLKARRCSGMTRRMCPKTSVS